MSTHQDVLAQVLPDLTGQPSWVYVVVSALVIAGTLGLAWIKRGSRTADPEDPAAGRPVDAQAVPSITAGGLDATQVIQVSLEHLARVAEREALESREARAETAALRRELVECGTELTAATRRAELAELELSRCQEHARVLGRQAFEKGAERDHG